MVMSKSTNEESLVLRKNNTDTEVKESTLYYFYSQGCGFCKQVQQHVDALIEEGYDILKLDVADGDNSKLLNEIKNEYKQQCGTPYFVDAETGNSVCGYREKNIIEKWANGEEIPAPPRPKSQMPRPPFLGSTGKEETKWKKEYKKWAEENSHLPNLKTAKEILESPRPKSQPPVPPNPNSTDEELNEWGKTYDEWKNENEHLPNLQPVETILQRFKQRANTNNVPIPNQSVQDGSLLSRIENKLDKIINHLGI